MSKLGAKSHANKAGEDLVVQMKDFYVGADDDYSLASTVSSTSNSTISQIHNFLDKQLSGTKDNDPSTVLSNIIKNPIGSQTSKKKVDFSRDDKSLRENDSKKTPKFGNKQNKANLFSSILSTPETEDRDQRSTYSESGSISCPEMRTMDEGEREGEGEGQISIDEVLSSLKSKKESDKLNDFPSQKNWEKKVNSLVELVDNEKAENNKLSEIENILQKMKSKVQVDKEVTKWKSKARELQSLLDEKRKEKKLKLILLAKALEELSKEKKEMKKLKSKTTRSKTYKSNYTSSSASSGSNISGETPKIRKSKRK